MKERPRLTIGALVFNLSGEILLLKSHKWENRYVIPCGHVEFMETMEEAVSREVLEETGLEIYGTKFLMFVEFINPPQYYKKNLHFVGGQYTCISKGLTVKLNDESFEHLWADPQESLNLNLEYGTRKAIEYFLNVPVRN